MESFSQEKLLRWVLWFFSSIYMTSIILFFTPYTYNVDEIKVAIMFSGGGFIFLLYLIYLLLVPQSISSFKILAPLFLFLIVFCLSIFFSPYRWVGIFNLGFYLFTMVMMFVAISTITNLPRLIHGCSLFSFLALVSCIFGYAHYLGGFGIIKAAFKPEAGGENYWYNLIHTLDKNQTQMFGTILSTDFFAAYLVMALPAAFALMFVAPQLYNRILGFITILAMAGCIYLTQSNETMLAVLVFIILFFLGYAINVSDSIIHRHWVLVSVLLFVVFLTAAFFTQSLIYDRWKHIGGAFTARYIIYLGAWEMFMDKPVLGWGPGSFRVIFPLFRDHDYWINEISNVTLFAHNQFLGLLSETGILGFITYMWFLIAVCWLLISEIRKRPSSPLSIIQYSFLGGILAIHIQNFFSPNYRWVAPAIAYNMMLGLAISAGLISKLHHTDESLSGNFSQFLIKNKKVLVSILIGFNIVLLYHFSFYGINYFKGAIANNTGILKMEQGDSYERQSRLVSSEQRKQYLNERAKRYKEASDLFAEAIQLNPYFLTSHYKLAHSYNAQGKRIDAIQTYNDMSYFAPDYSEVHFNYGIIFRVLHQEGKKIDIDYLQKCAELITKKKGVKFNLDFEELKQKNQLTEEEQKEVTFILKSLNKYDKKLKDLELNKLIVDGDKISGDRILLELGLHSLSIAAEQARKPQTWLSYIEALNQSGRKDLAKEKIAFVFSDEPLETKHTPIYLWKKGNRLLIKPLEEKYRNLDLRIHLELKEYDEIIHKLKNLLDEKPGNRFAFKTLLSVVAQYSKKDHALVLPYIKDMISQNPLNWRIHYYIAKYLYDVRQYSMSIISWLRAIHIAKSVSGDSVLNARRKYVIFPDTKTPNLKLIYYEFSRILVNIGIALKDKTIKEVFYNIALHYLETGIATKSNKEHMKKNESLEGKMNAYKVQIENLKKQNSNNILTAP